MRIAVVGTGYVGLVTGVCLASVGHDVTCVDLRDDVVESLNAGIPTIHERGLAELLRSVVARGQFHATTHLASAMADASLVLIAVGTPSVHGAIDLTQVEAAVRAVGAALRQRIDPVAVVIKSTVVPGTTDTRVVHWLLESSGLPRERFGVGMTPEFLREGEAIDDCLQPDRLVLGVDDEIARAALRTMVAPWSAPVLEVSTRTAELIKYANNCLLATQISAVNELANLASTLGGIDMRDVMTGVHLDRRWSPMLADGTRVSPGILRFLEPGCGFGGSCFPKDVQALRTTGTSLGLPMHVLNAVLDVNAVQPARVTALLQDALGPLRGRRVLLLGLAFKPGTDDVRESASLVILDALCDAGASVIAHDPVAGDAARRARPMAPFALTTSWRDVLAESDAIVVATRWEEYRDLVTPTLRAQLRNRVLIDARRLFDPQDFPGVDYRAIGYSPAGAVRPAA